MSLFSAAMAFAGGRGEVPPEKEEATPTPPLPHHVPTHSTKSERPIRAGQYPVSISGPPPSRFPRLRREPEVEVPGDESFPFEPSEYRDRTFPSSEKSSRLPEPRGIYPPSKTRPSPLTSRRSGPARVYPTPSDAEPAKKVTFSPPDPPEKPVEENEEDRLCREIFEGKEVDWIQAVSTGKTSVRVLLEAAARASNLEILDALLEEASEEDVEMVKRVPRLTAPVLERLTKSLE